MRGFKKNLLILILLAGLFFHLQPGLGAQSLKTPALPSGLKAYQGDRYFVVTPRVVPADRETTIRIVSRFETFPKPGYTYRLIYTPVGRYALKTGWKKATAEEIVPRENVFEITRYFEGEQEHIFRIEEVDAENRVRQVGAFHVYSLKPDLFALRPYKGDFHMHSYRSDGQESPAYVAGACRRVGLDFMALTDHRNYAGSLEAIETFRELPVDLRLYPGEEVHPPENPVHFVSFGARESISELIKKDEASYRKEVQAIMDKLKSVPEYVDKYQYASSLWTFQKIREKGGLGIFAHPYWRPNNANYISYALVDYIFENRIFDAVELVSGFGWNELQEVDVNNLQLNRYIEARAKGLKIPVVGISDSHGCEGSDQFGRYYTIVFSPSPELKDLIEAIKNEMAVAVETPGGELPRVYGPFRLVNYSHFLLRYVLPLHDEMCFEEGRLMIEYAGGNRGVLERLRLMKGQVQRYYETVWAK